MLVAGTLLGLFVLFTVIIPTVFWLLKLALLVSVIALVVFVIVTVMGRSSSNR